MTDNNRISGFEPIYRSNAKMLICGSMPSVASLENAFYYSHPRNAFWPMIAEILGEEYPKTIGDKKTLLIDHSIALWDTIAQCERKGSLDSAIRNVETNDFDTLYHRCPGIRAILFNGTTAMKYYQKYVCKSDSYRRYYLLPSTSPAYTIPYEEKRQQWAAVIREVLNESM